MCCSKILSEKNGELLLVSSFTLGGKLLGAWWHFQRKFYEPDHPKLVDSASRWRLQAVAEPSNFIADSKSISHPSTFKLAGQVHWTGGHQMILP